MLTKIYFSPSIYRTTPNVLFIKTQLLNMNNFSQNHKLYS